MQSREGKFLLAEFQCLRTQLIKAPGGGGEGGRNKELDRSMLGNPIACENNTRVF